MATWGSGDGTGRSRCSYDGTATYTPDSLELLMQLLALRPSVRVGRAAAFASRSAIAAVRGEVLIDRMGAE